VPRSTPPPYPAYAGILATFAGGLAGAGLVARALGRDARAQTPLDLAVLALATYKVSRTIARDDVGSVLRDPFVEDDEPVDTGDLRQAVGELVTCSRCVGTWAAAGLATTQIVAPGFGRLLTWTLATAGANDWLQAAFALLTNKANAAELASRE
jgi:uncharacterized protein DUF1360